MALPDSNISASLVGNTLGSSSRDVGTLCTHENINKWSKWKPVRFNKVTGISESDLQSINCGMDIKIVNSLESVITEYRSGEGSWGYIRPSGGSTSPYRLGDFRLYEHNVGKQYEINLPEVIIKNNVANIDTSVTFSRKFNPSGVTFDQLSRINTDLYYGALIVRSGTLAPYNYKIASRSIGDPLGGNPVSLDLTLPGTPSLGWTYDVMGFLAVPNESGKLPLPLSGNCTLWLLDGGHAVVQYSDLDIKSQLTIHKLVDGISVKLLWGITVTNNSSMPLTVSDLIITFKSTNYPQWNENPEMIQTFTVQPGSSSSFSGERFIAADHGVDRIDIFSNSNIYPKLYANSYTNI